MTPNNDDAAEFPGELTANGAQFWAYISPQNDTKKYVTDWQVTISQQDGDWSGTITSKNPQQTLQTPGLSGVFNVKVTAKVGAVLQPRTINVKDGCQADIGCNNNCASMVLIVADPGGGNATYCTTWDAYCNPGNGDDDGSDNEDNS